MIFEFLQEFKNTQFFFHKQSFYRPQSNAWQQSHSLSSPAHATQPSIEPWQPPSSKPDPWNPVTNSHNAAPAPRADPWSPTSQSSSTDLDEFDIITNRNKNSPKSNGHSNNNNNNSDPFELNLLGDVLPSAGPSPSTGATKKTPQSFLGENSALVNLDNLVTASECFCVH